MALERQEETIMGKIFEEKRTISLGVKDIKM